MAAPRAAGEIWGRTRLKWAPQRAPRSLPGVIPECNQESVLSTAGVAPKKQTNLPPLSSW